jgi:hypothetical protein
MNNSLISILFGEEQTEKSFYISYDEQCYRYNFKLKGREQNFISGVFQIDVVGRDLPLVRNFELIIIRHDMVSMKFEGKESFFIISLDEESSSSWIIKGDSDSLLSYFTMNNAYDNFSLWTRLITNHIEIKISKNNFDIFCYFSFPTIFVNKKVQIARSYSYEEAEFNSLIQEYNKRNIEDNENNINREKQHSDDVIVNIDIASTNDIIPLDILDAV